MGIKVQMPVTSQNTDDELATIREMGVEYGNLNVKPEELTLGTLKAIIERFARFDITISDIACAPLQKNPIINLGLPNRDGEIEKFSNMVRLCGQVSVPIVSVAWQPNGILRTGRAPGKHTRGGVSAYADMAEISARPYANGRAYSEQEIWDNFAYFLQCVIPVCEQSGVRMALHPNDPPVSCLAGVPSLIYNTACFERAFALAGDSHALAMKLCVGCWLEGGDSFGNLMYDIRRFTASNKIACVHFRNVSAPMPYFEETLSEDGYADMYAIMKQFVACGYDGLMSVDHAFEGRESTGGMLGAFAYPTGHLKGLLHAAECELK